MPSRWAGTTCSLRCPASASSSAGDGALAGDVPEAREGGRFLDALDRWLARERHARAATAHDAVFADGWFLYLGYELAAEIEPTLRLPRSALPRAVAWRMHGALLRDRRSGEIRVVARDESAQEQLRAQVAADSAIVAQGAQRPRPARLATAVVEQEPGVFIDGVRDVLAAIARGDVYQANLSRSWRAQLAPQATVPDLYRALRRANPAPFAALAQLEDFALLSSSPERLLQLQAGVASTRPIAGTRPRGGDEAADAAAQDASCSSTRRNAPSTSCWSTSSATTSAGSVAAARSKSTSS